MKAISLWGTKKRVPDSDPGRHWAYYVLAVYPVVFLGGTVGVGWILTTTTDTSLFSASLLGGYIFVGLSVLALLTYPAYRIDATTVSKQNGWSPSFRRFLGIGIGIPIGVGVFFELLSFGFAGGITFPGAMAGFVAVVFHPFVIFFATLRYLIQRRRLRAVSA